MIASMASASAAVAERMARPSGKRDIRRVFLLHADGVIARVDMVGFAGDAASEIAQQIERRAADVVDRDVAAQRGVMFIPLEDQAEVADSARGKRLDRSRRDRVHTHALRAIVRSEEHTSELQSLMRTSYAVFC